MSKNQQTKAPYRSIPSNMEEALSLIIHGCKLARDLELNLPHLSTQPIFLSNSCDEIVRVFNTAMDRLNSYNPSSSNPHMVFQESPPQARPSELDVGVQEWLKSSYKQAMDVLQAQFLADPKNPFSKVGMMEPPELGLEIPAATSGLGVLELGVTDTDYVGDTDGSTRSKSEGKFQMQEGSESGKSTPMAAQRSRKRKDSVDKHTMTVAAPRMGNTEIPPEDGFTWRKYGQKEILGSKFPRGYYRCTHKSFYGCEAKKQVQRLDNDPDTFEVTYYGSHTCLMSSTAPSVPPSADIKQEAVITTRSSSPSTSIPLSRWLSMDFEAMSRKDTSTLMDPHMHRDFNMGGSGSSSAGAAGTSHVRDAKEPESPVLYLADAMFNSGSSSNSMDSIFPPTQDK